MPTSYVFPSQLDVDWQPWQSVTLPDPYLKNWLLDTGSLTERIQSMSRQFEVNVLGQGKAPLQPHEQRHVGSTPVSVREVVLLADHQPWVFARSILPDQLINGEWQSLGSQPLGSRLFNDSRFVRGKFEVAQLDSQHFYSLNVEPVSHELYGRRSVFSYEGIKITVAEIFLPAAPAYSRMGQC